MNINYKETQYNFLENASASSRDPHAPRVLSAQMVLSVENLVIFSIASIMVMLFCFSVGVERGRRLALSDVKNAPEVVSQPILSGPGKTLLTDDDDLVSTGKARKNIFEAFLTPGNGQGKSASKVAPPAIDQSVPDPKSAKETKTTGIQEKPVKAVRTEVAGIPAAPNGSYTIQVGSYKTEKSAAREAQNLKQKGYREVYVLPKGAFVIVCVGNFPTKSDASTFTRHLKDRYQDTVVRRL